MVIVPAGLIEEVQGKRRPYTEHLSKKAQAGNIPPAPPGEPSFTLFPTIDFLASPNTLLCLLTSCRLLSKRSSYYRRDLGPKHGKKMNDGLVSTYLIAVF